jgi:hypothetical protein
MKVAIQGLGEVPTTVKLVLEKEKPDIMYVICSDYQLGVIATNAGYTERNEAVVRAAAKEAGTKLVIKRCNVFDVEEIGDVLGEILQEIKGADEIIVNYAGGSACLKVMLGITGVVLSRLMRARLLYAIEYPNDVKIVEDHTQALKEIFKQLYEFL